MRDHPSLGEQIAKRARDLRPVGLVRLTLDNFILMIGTGSFRVHDSVKSRSFSTRDHGNN
jgi:hypothetical protein